MMIQVASQTEIGKICSKRSPCSASRLSRPADSYHAAKTRCRHLLGSSPDSAKDERVLMGNQKAKVL